MELAFKTKKLRAMCEEEQIAKTNLGADTARSLFARLADLEAAADLSEVIAGNPRIYRNEKLSLVAIDIGNEATIAISLPALAGKPIEDEWRSQRRAKIEWIRKLDDEN